MARDHIMTELPQLVRRYTAALHNEAAGWTAATDMDRAHRIRAALDQLMFLMDTVAGDHGGRR